jgi:iron complex outermembrane receptor protein
MSIPRSAGLILAGWSICCAPPLTAAPATPGGARPDTAVVPLGEVVVVGARVPELLRYTPAALSVVGRDRYADTRNISLKDALGGVPGVFVQSRAGSQDVRLTIRGFGARGSGDRSNYGSMRGVRVLTDGIPVTEPDGRTALDLVDLALADHIEVSRSNASAVFGNASGGVINLDTDLGFDAPYVEYRELGGAYGYHREQATTGFRLGESRAVLAFSNSTFEGWRRHSSGSRSLAQFRLASALGPGTRLGLLLDGASDLNRFPGALTGGELAADPRQANAAFVTRDERRRNRQGRAGVTLDQSLAPSQTLAVNLFVEPKALQRSERNSFRDFNRYHVGGAAIYRGARALGSGFEGVLSAGADDAFQDGAIQFYSLTPAGGRGTTLKADKREGASSAGGFVQTELRWRERWSARLAARYDDLWYIAEDHMDPTLDATKRFVRWTPKASLAFSAAEHTVYAALGGGVEAPAFNEVDPPPWLPATSLNPLLDATRSTTYEVGGRGSLPGGAAHSALRYDAALYWIDVRDDLVPWDGGGYFFTAGKTRRRGAELGLDWTPLPAITLAGAVTLADNEYVEYVRDDTLFDGNAVAGLPRALFNGSARWTAPGGFALTGTVESVDGYYADDANRARTLPYTLLGATASYTRVIGAGTLSAFVSGQNLADKPHVASVFINGTGGRFYEPGLPRNVSGGITLRWR